MICCLSLTSVNFLSKIWAKWWISRACCLQFEQLKSQLWHTSSREETREHLTVYAIVWWLSEVAFASLKLDSVSWNELSNAEGRINKSWSCFLCGVMIISQTEWLLFSSHAVCFYSVSTFLHWISFFFFFSLIPNAQV